MTTVNVIIAIDDEKVKECVVIPGDENNLEWGVRQALKNIYGAQNVCHSSCEIGHIPDNISRYIIENYPRAVPQRNQWIPYTSNMSAPANGKRVLAKLSNDWVCCATYYLDHQKDGNCQWKWKDDRAQEIVSVKYWKGLEE